MRTSGRIRAASNLQGYLVDLIKRHGVWNQTMALLTFIVLVGLPTSVHANAVFSQCGGHLRAPQGIIQSPNFPGPFPVPISCRWVIHVPANSKTVIYFTQVRYIQTH
ncbi:cadherin EGF LAG seven-pass G-type receptor 3 [Elysia marginata]|uniref:Cadherin EGF LAG seven-pass G-type receptor 3 n=1 Tax=Elysia marginata TaxID=1093978 RepID=A0AAV4G1V6_9GAST|nr:cadherin EGF LAG seven-pass G-type receptor 3 [Elysia marginata]